MTEEQAKEGLDICGYSGKWKNAMRHASIRITEGATDYWAEARKVFLELGGGYLKDKCTCKDGEVIVNKLPDMSFLHEERNRQMQPYFKPRRG